MTVTVCRHCGADISQHPFRMPESGAVGRCPDCGLSPDDGLPAQYRFSADEAILYRLDDWTPSERLAIALALHDVPFHWDPGPVLVVREEGQAVVEAFLDDLAQDTVGNALWPDDGPADEDGENEPLLGELFVTADRLLHAPWDVALLAHMAHLTAVALRAGPPFGIEPPAWEEIRVGAAAVTAADRRDDDEGVEEGARHLRELLRELV